MHPWQSPSDNPAFTQEELDDVAAEFIKLHEQAVEIAAAARAQPGYAERRLRWEQAMGRRTTR